LLLTGIAGWGQDSVVAPSARSLPATDTVKANDTSKRIVDTASITPSVPKLDTSYYKLLRNPYLPGINNPLYLIIKERERTSKDELFYLLAGLLMFLAFSKFVFPKYFQNIFQLFFQPQFRQKQTREQLLQNNLPSLFFNLFFILASGTYIALLAIYFNVAALSFTWLFLYSVAALAILYVTKYIVLSFSGWVFNVKEASETYIFITYLINKIIGILLVPFILIIAFANDQIKEVSITVSVLLLSLLFLYRYVISFAPVRREVKVSPLHFFFYIFAFEITPLLLIYKLLANYLHRSA
jgi:hypothetical protein